MITKEILAHLRGYERAATPGPWIYTGHELYFGKQMSRVTSVQISAEEDARLIAVMRSWLPDLLDIAEKSLEE